METANRSHNEQLQEKNMVLLKGDESKRFVSVETNTKEGKGV